MSRKISYISFNFTLLAIIVLALSTMVLAQSSGSTAGAITGTIKDIQGGAIVGATIRVKQLETDLERVATVGEDGNYTIAQLAPGSYEIRVEAAGFSSQLEKATINIGRTLLANFTLSVGETKDVIEVDAEVTADANKTESSTNFGRQQIENLPINRRDFLDYAILSPRVLTDRLPPTGTTPTSGLSFNGVSGHFNNITIDGVDNNDAFSGSVRATFSQDAVNEFQVISDGFSAEFGRSLGGVVNIVTKSGQNEFNGNLFLFNRNDKTSARDALSARIRM
jgi:hypothetical protein